MYLMRIYCLVSYQSIVFILVTMQTYNNWRFSTSMSTVHNIIKFNTARLNGILKFYSVCIGNFLALYTFSWNLNRNDTVHFGCGDILGLVHGFSLQFSFGLNMC